jgi:hypothetical protein
MIAYLRPILVALIALGAGRQVLRSLLAAPRPARVPVRQPSRRGDAPRVLP